MVHRQIDHGYQSSDDDQEASPTLGSLASLGSEGSVGDGVLERDQWTLMTKGDFVVASPRKKRFRRSRVAIARQFACSFLGCKKSYGTIGHLNTHIRLKQHGDCKTTEDFFGGGMTQ